MSNAVNDYDLRKGDTAKDDRTSSKLQSVQTLEGRPRIHLTVRKERMNDERMQ